MWRPSLLQSYATEIKLAHVATVLLSGGLFLLRGVLVQAGHSARALSVPLRYASYSIDSALLIAALLLLTILPAAVYSNGWLTTKIMLLLVYIVLGSFALKRARTPRNRFCCFVAALLTYAFMLTIAWTHQPLGVFAVWPGR